ncbi:hypothetical protein ERO13_A01G185580v2 [Gossypium hirsutum]|nr:hypothetical protein ERO13_A01G185580v2 [Gossypium hirsutum]
MWPDLIQKAKDGGLDTVETYIFWNAHEPIRRQGSNLLLPATNSIILHYHYIKAAFCQSDGRWHFSSNNPESNAFAAGIALETLAGVVSLASLELDQSLVVLLV